MTACFVRGALRPLRIHVIFFSSIDDDEDSFPNQYKKFLHKHTADMEFSSHMVHNKYGNLVYVFQLILLLAFILFINSLAIAT